MAVITQEERSRMHEEETARRASLDRRLTGAPDDSRKRAHEVRPAAQAGVFLRVFVVAAVVGAFFYLARMAGLEFQGLPW